MYAMGKHQYREKIDDNIVMLRQWLYQDVEKKKEISSKHIEELEKEYNEIIDDKIKALKFSISLLENLKKDVLNLR